MEKVKVGLVDDHVLFRKGIRELINGFQNFTITLEANNGKELISQLVSGIFTDIILLDINMPLMNGFETVQWLKEKYAEIKILALSMYDTEETIIKMIKLGVNGYILKDAEPSELKIALDSLLEKGFYYSELVSKSLINNINAKNGKEKLRVVLNDREMEFLKLACTEYTYKEIADNMCLSVRTVDGYRDALFERLDVKNRVGLVLYAIKNGIVNLS